MFAFLTCLVSCFPVVYADDHSKAVVLMLYLFCVAL